MPTTMKTPEGKQVQTFAPLPKVQREVLLPLPRYHDLSLD